MRLQLHNSKLAIFALIFIWGLSLVPEGLFASEREHIYYIIEKVDKFSFIKITTANEKFAYTQPSADSESDEVKKTFLVLDNTLTSPLAMLRVKYYSKKKKGLMFSELLEVGKKYTYKNTVGKIAILKEHYPEFLAIVQKRSTDEKTEILKSIYARFQKIKIDPNAASAKEQWDHNRHYNPILQYDFLWGEKKYQNANFADNIDDKLTNTSYINDLSFFWPQTENMMFLNNIGINLRYESYEKVNIKFQNQSGQAGTANIEGSSTALGLVYKHYFGLTGLTYLGLSFSPFYSSEEIMQIDIASSNQEFEYLTTGTESILLYQFNLNDYIELYYQFRLPIENKLEIALQDDLVKDEQAGTSIFSRHHFLLSGGYQYFYGVLFHLKALIGYSIDNHAIEINDTQKESRINYLTYGMGLDITLN